MQVYITAIEEGFLYGLLALGIYISLRILDIPDLTTEGSFGFGSAVAAIVASKGLSVTSFIAAFAAGVLAGIVTGLLQTKLKVHPVLAGIITMSGLYSINLMVRGSSNLNFNDNSAFTRFYKAVGISGADKKIAGLVIGAVICIQIKLNIQSPWMPLWVSGYVTREIMLLEFSSSIMCLILSGKVGSNIASELGTMRTTLQIDALEIMGVNSASFLILPKIIGLVTIMPLLVVFSTVSGIIGAYATAYIGHIITPSDLTAGLQHSFTQWFFWMGVIKSLFFAFIISSVSSFYGLSLIHI